MENFNDPNSVVCFYCQEYHILHFDVPLNDAKYNLDGITPRCFLHYKYECSKCELNIHFNGISWCHDCKLFTCVECGNVKVNKENFLIYDYYFKIQCTNCGSESPALDYAELSGNHPYQLGDLWPNQPINIWLPTLYSDENPPKFKKLSGSDRMRNLSNWVLSETNQQFDEKSTWHRLFSDWTEFLGKDHRLLLEKFYLPEILKLIDPMPHERILEVGCGEGQLSRRIAKLGANVIGIEPSKMVDTAISHEKREILNILYYRLQISDFKNDNDKVYFDKIVCNLRLMIIEDLPTFFDDVFHLLKENGELIFSISHPFFGIPNGIPIKVPDDSYRNEDKIWLMENYFTEGLVNMTINGVKSQSSFFRRTLSTYINVMIASGFSILQISEPQADVKLVENYTHPMYNNIDRIPGIMIIRAKKITSASD